MTGRNIVIHDARQNNLRGVSVEIPRRSFTVVTGPSGSGKSSLAFDTLYAEGQRRYVESLSTYAKQFLERMAKPDVGKIHGISPAVAIEQKNPTTSSRSTVGTATEIYDYFRLLWARVGKPHCVDCGEPVNAESASTAAARLVKEHSGVPLVVCFPLPRSASSEHQLIAENLQSMGFIRVHTGSEFHRIDELPEKVRLDRGEINVVVDRLTPGIENQGRLADSLALAFAVGDGYAVTVAGERVTRLSSLPACTGCGRLAARLTPNLFSFNNPHGACERCNGFGANLEYDTSLIVPDPDLTLGEGAIDPWMKPRYVGRRRMLREAAKREGIDHDKPWKSLGKRQQELLLRGKSGRFVGVIPFLRALEKKRYKQYIRVFLRQYQTAQICSECGGSRLKPDPRSVQVGGRGIADVSTMSSADIADWIGRLELSDFDRSVADTILKEIKSRLGFLLDVGLGYLTLDRQTRTLSGGEAQRISLSNALGSRLVDTLYVLDEPSIGLHSRDVDRLVSLLKRLRDGGNTVVVVEHDPATILESDHMIEIGPGSGENGGLVTFTGSVDEAVEGESLTGSYLSGINRIGLPSFRRRGRGHISIEGATLHNIEDLDVEIPRGVMTVVTGVSGSGKSTLVHDILYRRASEEVVGSSKAKVHLGEVVGHIDAIDGLDGFDDVVLVDQSPIGKSPRSNPITYVRAFDEVRNLFAQQPLAASRGYTAATFSFNAANGGRCPQCEGAGYIQIEMVFMADVFSPCDACHGTRFKPEVLDVKVRNSNIADVLNLTVDDAVIRFKHQPKLGKALWHLQQVGLGYLRLGQPATTLSGGESQRLKIARQLNTVKKGTRLYILDEPTTGLHMSDVKTLIKVLDRLVDAGHTVVVIEHNMDLIKRADWILDMGPEGGPGGGQLVGAGIPEDIAALDTHTALFLRPELEALSLADQR